MRRRIAVRMLGLIVFACAGSGLIGGVHAGRQPVVSLAAVRPSGQTLPEQGTQTARCGVKAADLRMSGNSVILGVRSNGDEAASLQSLKIYWPAQDELNGPLQAVQMGDRAILDEATPDSPALISVEPGRVLPIPTGFAADLTFTFAGAAQPLHYVIDAAFEPDCRLLFSTRSGGDACDVIAASPLKIEGNTLKVTLNNRALEAVEVRAIDVEWPAGAGSLRAALLGTQLLWQGDAAASPATIIPDPQWVFTPSFATAQTELSLVFAEESIPDGPYAVDVSFVEGCHAFISNDAAATPSRVVRFGGAIRGLPADLLGEWQVGDYSVWVDPRTVVKSSEARPAVDMWAEVTALSQANGTLLALKIDVDDSGEGRRVELRGTVESYQAGEPGLLVVEGRQVVVGPATAIHGVLASGVVAKVSGVLLSDGRVNATRIVVTPAAAAASEVVFKGLIKACPDGRPSLWVIGPMTITITDSTVVTGTVRVGKLAEVKATVLGDGRAVAQEVRVREANAPGTVRRVVGLLEGFPNQLAAGLWTVRDERSPDVQLDIKADKQTFIDQSRGRPRVGGRVVAYLRQNSTGQWQAIRIETMRPEQTDALRAPGRQ